MDGILKTVTESSIRRNLKLNDEEGLSSLLDMELFENLTLMGYNISPNQKFTFQKGSNFPSMEGEGSGTPTEPHHTPSPEAQLSSHTHISSPTLPTVTPIPTVTLSDTPIIRQYTKRTRIAQSSVPPTIADEPASPLKDVSQGEACPTDSGFIADQDRATISKSSTFPHDSAPRVTSPTTVEGSMQQSIPKLTALCTSLQRQLFELTVKFQAHEEEINRLKGEAIERINDDSEEMATVLTSIDVATVLASRVIDVPTGSGSIPTASTPAKGSVPTGSEEVPTASPVFSTATVVTPYRRKKGNEVMVESKTPKKQKVQEQIDAQVARELEEQLEREDQKRAEQIARDEEVARIHVEEELQKVTKEAKPPEEVTEEKVKEMMQLVPIEEVYVEALQVKHPIIDWKHMDREDLNQLWRLVKETLSNRQPTSDKEMELWVKLNKIVHHVTSKDKEIFMVVEKDYPLRKGLALVMICYKLQVENFSQMANDLVLQIYKIANSLRQQGD
nr:hypothetical protein [Tanacetum cinerariifolium]